MTRPKILKETKRQIDERKPPSKADLRAHDWLSEESKAVFRRILDSSEPFDMYLSDKAEEKIRNHAMKEAPKRLEVMGFLLGEVNSWEGKPYTIVRDVGTTALKSSSSKVRFDPDAFPELFLELDDSGFDYVLVGWYHSHPGHTCFLSRTDLDTQRTMFNQPYHSALVIDPINRAIKTFRLAGETYEEIPFAVFTPRSQTSAKPKSMRRRKLKVRPATTL